MLQPYYEDATGKEARYYQAEAINRTVEAVAAGQGRVLLVMATGTGKTYTTFQIIWRLWKAGRVKRALFLADRNILVDQALINDFKPFGPAMSKVTGHNIDPAYEVHLALYQAITGREESEKAFKRLSPEFFDLIVIDECHRGSAADDAQWREILDYFSTAIQFGMTANSPNMAPTVTIVAFLRSESCLRSLLFPASGGPINKINLLFSLTASSTKLSSFSIMYGLKTPLTNCDARSTTVTDQFQEIHLICCRKPLPVNATVWPVQAHR